MPRRRLRLLDGLVVILAALVVLAVAVVLRGPVCIRSAKIDCMLNVGELVGILESLEGTDCDGANLVLRCFGRQGHWPPHSEDYLGVLFCPGDARESLAAAGGPAAYGALDLTAPCNGRLTSYAGRRLRDPACTIPKDDRPGALLADDSDDHHADGFVVGYSGGTVKWRGKERDWGLADDTRVEVGPGSAVPELQCLSAD
jgi:hypothetical protein